MKAPEIPGHDAVGDDIATPSATLSAAPIRRRKPVSPATSCQLAHRPVTTCKPRVRSANALSLLLITSAAMPTRSSHDVMVAMPGCHPRLAGKFARNDADNYACVLYFL